MKTIAIEDLVTIVCTEFVKQNKGELQIGGGGSKYEVDYNSRDIPYLKMNYNRRRKISEKLIEKIMGD